MHIACNNKIHMNNKATEAMKSPTEVVLLKIGNTCRIDIELYRENQL